MRKTLHPLPSTHDPSDNAPTILSFVSTTGTTKVLPLLPRPQQAEENTVSSSVSSCSSSRRVELLRPSDSVNLTCIISKDGCDADGTTTTTTTRVYVLWVLLSQPSMGHLNDPLGPLYLSARIDGRGEGGDALICGGGTTSAANYADQSIVSSPFALVAATRCEVQHGLNRVQHSGSTCSEPCDL